MTQPKIRPARRADLNSILKIYDSAREFMARSGNPTQWAGGYPEPDLLMEDISRGRLFVVIRKNRICGVFAFITGADPTYTHIEGGTWRSDAPYGTIHRIASDGTGGIFDACMTFCRSRCEHLRIDTHRCNKPMQHLAEKAGFVRRGIIYVADGTPRIAYDMIPEEA